MTGVYSIPAALGLFLLISCSKDLSRETANGTSPNPDSTRSGSNAGNLLAKEVEVWTNGSSDSTAYQYNSAKQLISVHTVLAGVHDISYSRDAQQRIISEISGDTDDLGNKDSGSTEVTYANPTSEKVAFTTQRVSNAGNLYLDSSVYIYNQNNQVSKIILYAFITSSYEFNSYDSFTYDENGNLKQYQIYVLNPGGGFGLNIGYDFEYDNAINPLYSHDDVRLPDAWYLSASPNNLVKQTNHYGNPPLLNDDFVTTTYQYNANNEPAMSIRGGSAIGTNAVQVTYYYQ